jgi:ABC-type polysaccharide/polyol phosphate export permease
MSLFFSLIGTGSLLTFLIMSIFPHKDVPMYRLVQKSFRVGLLLSGILVILLFLQGKDILTKWNSLLLLFIGITITCFFLSTRYFVNKET